MTVPIPPTKMLITITKTGGKQLNAVKAADGCPLISANTIARRVHKGEEGPDPSPERLRRYGMTRPYRRFKNFKLDAPGLLAPGFKWALDSAGFVAMTTYGDYDWSVEEYVRLAAAYAPNLLWWAQMDACCEPEVAGDPRTVRLRQCYTLDLLARCEREARDLGIPGPMPVLQGWTVADYVWHAKSLGNCRGYTMVGVGSMCRRDTEGPEGLLAVVEALDRVLDEHVRLHLFGVKSTALESLAAHPRVASVDSNAWDLAARNKAHYRDKCKATTDYKCQYMHEWYGRQVARIAEAQMWAQVLELYPSGNHELPDDWANEITDLVADGELEYQAAGYHMAYEAYARSNPEGRNYEMEALDDIGVDS